MKWWCAAQGTAWDWSWQPYPGVWLFTLLVLGWYFAALTRWRPSEGPPATAGQLRSYVLGAALLWIAADWPLGPLGAGYLVSVHTVQYLLFAMVVPALLIHGMPPWLLRRMLRPRWAAALAHVLSRPLVAFAVFNLAMLATHLPQAVDGLTPSQLGSFAVDMTWLVSGLLFWWQILGPLPELRPMSLPGRIVFVLLNMFIPTVPASFLTFADYPIYALYELAPPIGTIAPAQDQQVAGLIMKMAGGLIMFGTASVLFFKWHRAEAATEGTV